jgi:hypothetical protein
VLLDTASCELLEQERNTMPLKRGFFSKLIVPAAKQRTKIRERLFVRIHSAAANGKPERALWRGLDRDLLQVEIRVWTSPNKSEKQNRRSA